MKMQYLFSIGAFLGSTICQATPLLLDTPTAQIVISNPEDSFYENVSTGKDVLEDFTKKNFSYSYVDSSGHRQVGYKMLIGGISETPITNVLTPSLQKYGISLVTSNFGFSIQAPILIPPSEVNDFIKGQTQIFKLSVEHQGNPEDLVSKATKQRFLGNVAAVGLMLVGMNKLGPTTGSQLTMGSGLSDSVYSAVSKNKAALVASDFTNIDIDFANASFIQARKIQSVGGKYGQLLIAYKVPMTPEVENAAMVEAIVSLAGVNRTPEDIIQARQADFDHKKQIWQTCVQEGRCPAQ